MIKYSFLLLLVVLPFASPAQAQVGPTGPDNSNTDSLLKVFQKRIDSLETLVNNLNSSDIKSYADNYNKSYRNALLAIDLLQTLQSTVKSIIADRNQAEATNLLNQINNPTSNQLGFVFTERVITLASQVISSSNLVDEQKSKIKNTITNIVNGIAQSFPPLNIVTSVISTIGSLNIPFIEKLGKKNETGG